MTKGFQGLIAAFMLVPTLSAAESLSYSYLEGGLAVYPGFESQTLLGVDVRGAYAFDENIFAFGGLKYLSDDIDLTAFHVGGAYRHGLDSKTDVWGGVTVEYQEFDGGRECFSTFNGRQCFSASVDDTSLGLRGGLRHQLDEKLEVGGSARLVTGDLDYIGLTATGRYALEKNLKLLGEVDLYDGEIGLIGGVTLEF